MTRNLFLFRVMAGLFVWLLVGPSADAQGSKNRRIEMAIETFEQIGAVITYTDDDRLKPLELTFARNSITDDEMSQLVWLTTLESVDFNSAQLVTSEGFVFLKFLPNLRTLNLGGTYVTDRDLKLVTQLKKLETLHLWLTDIGDDALDPIADHPKLHTLNLWDAEISDAGIAKLAKCKTLRRLYLGRTIDRPLIDLGQDPEQIAVIPRITDDGIAALQAELPNAKIFYFNAQSKKAPSKKAPSKKTPSKKTPLESPRTEPKETLSGDTEPRGTQQLDADKIRARIRRVAEPEVPNIATRRSGFDWTTFLGPTRDSKSAETNIVTSWPESGPKIAWQTKIGDSHGTCAVYRGRLFLMDRVGDSSRLLCRNSETGEALWKYEAKTQYVDQVGYGNGPRCSPIVEGNRVYAYQADGVLHCVSVINGELLWKVDTAKDFGFVQYFFGVGSTPTIEGDLLFVVVGGSPQKQSERQVHMDTLEGNGSGIVAFNKFTGEVVYGITSALASYASPTFATIDDRRWGFVFARGELIGFDPSNGKVDFHFPWKARFKAAVSAATPIVVGNEVFISEAYGPGSCLLKVRPGDYEVVWQDDPRSREKAMQLHWNTPIYHEGFLYGCSGRHAVEGEIRCVEWKTGQVMWRVAALNRSSLLFVDKHFIALGEYGELLVFKANGKEFQSVSGANLKDGEIDDDDAPPLLKYPAWSAPVLSHGRLYVRGKDRFICIDLQKGKALVLEGDFHDG